MQLKGRVQPQKKTSSSSIKSIGLVLVCVIVLTLTIRAIAPETFRQATTALRLPEIESSSPLTIVEEFKPIIETINLEPGQTKQISLMEGLTIKDQKQIPAFIKINGSQLQISPLKGNSGAYILQFNKDGKLAATYNITVQLKPIDEVKLKADMLAVLGDQADKYGVFVYDTERKVTIGINEKNTLPPASISKIPIAIMALREVDKGNIKLDQKFRLKSFYKVYSFDAMSNMPTGSMLTLDKYINNMVVLSDNTAMTGLEDILGGTPKLNQRYKSELGITNFFRDPHDATAEEIGKVMIGIHDQKFLSKESNDYLLNYMKNTASWLQDRIPAKLPKDKNIEVAHKIGQITTNGGLAYNDGGIVYGEKTNFIIVVIDQDVSEANGRENISTISRLVYDTLN